MAKSLYILFLFMAFSIAQPVMVLAGEGDSVMENIVEGIFDFSLSIDDNQVEIAWENLPKNTKSFKIERSFDGKRYSRIYQSSLVTEKDYLDDLTYVRADDMVYYRFTFTKTNGEEVVSSSKLISLSAQNHLKAQVVANGGQIEFDYYSTSNAYTSVQIFNSVGNVLVENEIRSSKGQNSHSLSLYDARSGMYFLRLEQDGKFTTTKFFVR